MLENAITFIVICIDQRSYCTTEKHSVITASDLLASTWMQAYASRSLELLGVAATRIFPSEWESNRYGTRWFWQTVLSRLVLFSEEIYADSPVGSLKRRRIKRDELSGSWNRQSGIIYNKNARTYNHKFRPRSCASTVLSPSAIPSSYFPLQVLLPCQSLTCEKPHQVHQKFETLYGNSIRGPPRLAYQTCKAGRALQQGQARIM